MIWVLLQSDSPWQRNDAITFFIYFCVFYVPGVFVRNRLREFVPAIILSIMMLKTSFQNISKTLS